MTKKDKYTKLECYHAEGCLEESDVGYENHMICAPPGTEDDRFLNIIEFCSRVRPVVGNIDSIEIITKKGKLETTVVDTGESKAYSNSKTRAKK
jgi:hypothetical protein